MKKRMLPLASALVLVACTSCGAPKLSLYTWGNYIAPEVLSAFEKDSGYNVNKSVFETNEEMLLKLADTSFDIVCPSDYAIEELAKEGKLLELDQTKFKNYKKDSSLVPTFKADLDALASGTDGFDLLKYAVPYTFGEVGIIYDSSKISEDEIKTEGWEALRTAKNKDSTDRKVCLYDASRDAFSIALSALGYDFVNPTDDQIAGATNWLKELKTRIGSNFYLEQDQILDDMAAHKFDICMTYSGDAVYCMQTEVDSRHDLRFYIPDPIQGSSIRTNLYTDALCIPKDCANVDKAYEFIDAMCLKENAMANTEYIGYTTPIAEAYNAELAAGGAMVDYAQAFAVNPTAQDHFYRANEKLRTHLEEIWVSQISTQA